MLLFHDGDEKNSQGGGHGRRVFLVQDQALLTDLECFPSPQLRPLASQKSDNVADPVFPMLIHK